MLTLLFSRSEQVPNQSLSKWRDVYQHRSRHIPMWLSCWLHWNELWKRYGHYSMRRHGYVYIYVMHTWSSVLSYFCPPVVLYLLCSISLHLFLRHSPHSLPLSLYPCTPCILARPKSCCYALWRRCLSHSLVFVYISTKNYLITKINS